MLISAKFKQIIYLSNEKYTWNSRSYFSILDTKRCFNTISLSHLLYFVATIKNIAQHYAISYIFQGKILKYFSLENESTLITENLK